MRNEQMFIMFLFKYILMMTVLVDDTEVFYVKVHNYHEVD